MKIPIRGAIGPHFTQKHQEGRRESTCRERHDALPKRGRQAPVKQNPPDRPKNATSAIAACLRGQHRFPKELRPPRGEDSVMAFVGNYRSVPRSRQVG